MYCSGLSNLLFFFHYFHQYFIFNRSANNNTPPLPTLPPLYHPPLDFDMSSRKGIFGHAHLR